MKNKGLSIILSAVLAVSLLSGCASDNKSTASTAAPSETTAAQSAEVSAATPASENTSSEIETADAPAAVEADNTVIRIGAMSGPTAMGMVKLMSDSENGLTDNTYDFADLATDASAFVAPIAQGELDIAAVPANLASAIYNKTNGGIKVLAVNTLGVLNLVERGETLESIKDIAGRKVYATGQSAVPEYVIRNILKGIGIDPDKDVELHWCSDTTEALSFLKSEAGAAAILPQPFATAAAAQIEDLRIVQDLNDAWAELDTGCEITTGVTVVRTEFAEAHPEAVETFLKEYSASAAFTSENIDEAASLIEKYGIVAKAPLAKKALPACHIVCLTGSEMKAALQGFLQVLYDQKPEAVGGKLPGDDFYYGCP